MTRCVEWYDKFEKDGDFCHLSPAGISSVKAYNELRAKIAHHIPDKAFVVDNFPEGAARPLIHCKDDETRVKGLNYVIDCLARKEKVTAVDLQTTINGWLKPNACTVVKKGDNPGHVSKNFTNVKSPSEQKPILPVEKPIIAPLHPSLADKIRKDEMVEAEKNQHACGKPATPPFSTKHCQAIKCKEYRKNDDNVGQACCQITGYIPGNMPACPLDMDVETFERYNARHKGTGPEPVVQELPPPPPKPAPCTLLKQCPDLNYHCKTEKVRGRVCDVIGIPCNQLPDNECPLERKNRLKGTAPAQFVRAGELMDELDAAKPIKPVPLKISKVRLTDSERDSYCDALVERTGFTAKDIEQIDELVTAGYDGCKCRFDLVETAVMQYLAKAEGA